MIESDLSLPRPPPRSLLFARTRESLADSLSAAVTDALPAIADELDAAADRALDGRERQGLLDAAQQTKAVLQFEQHLGGIGAGQGPRRRDGLTA